MPVERQGPIGGRTVAAGVGEIGKVRRPGCSGIDRRDPQVDDRCRGQHVGGMGDGVIRHDRGLPLTIDGAHGKEVLAGVPEATDDQRLRLPRRKGRHIGLHLRGVEPVVGVDQAVVAPHFVVVHRVLALAIVGRGCGPGQGHLVGAGQLGAEVGDPARRRIGCVYTGGIGQHRAVLASV